MTTTTNTRLFDEFQRYHIPNIYVQWYDLEPTLYVFPGNLNTRQTETHQTHHHHQQVDEKKKKVRATSAYALFFREKQAIEKRAAPHATFGQISQSIARQWEALSEEEKKAYKQRCEKNRNTSITNAVEEKARQLMMMTSSKLQ